MRNNYQGPDDMIRMEKKSSNKVGIIIIVILVLALVGGSAFYFHKNGISIDLKLPWQTEKRASKNDSNKEDKSDDEEKTKNEYDPPFFEDRDLGGSYEYELNFSNFHKSSLGYDMDITFETKGKPFTIYLEKVLVDGYDTSVTFSKSLNPYESITQTLRINQSELDALDIISFSSLDLYIKCVDADGKGKVQRYELSTTGTITADNSRKGLIQIDQKNQTNVNYYKVQEDKDNTYIYFDFKNYGTIRTQIVSVKKLLINGKLYDYKDLNEEVYHGAEKIISLTIPKSDFKKVESFTVSFTMINEEEGKKTAAYITNEYSKTV